MKQKSKLALFVIWLFSSAMLTNSPTWGFHAHRIINRMAVFILPPEMIGFYKKNIEDLTAHSTDPDKRRYSVANEAIKHYMDLDHWGEHPYAKLPRDLARAMGHSTRIAFINKAGDSLWARDIIPFEQEGDILFIAEKKIAWTQMDKVIHTLFFPLKGTYHREISIDSLNTLLGITIDSTQFIKAIIMEDFSQHGIGPYNVFQQYSALKRAFMKGHLESILRISADLGHYVADIHVPLHASSNYNGQLTGQHGIHAFWESRLPELFAESEYHYFVGKARYIPNVLDFAMNAIIESNRLHHEVLSKELEVRQSMPEDRHFAYDVRLGKRIRVQSQEFSRAYHDLLDGMVEQRMQDAVFALGSIWFTAWVDAGQPVLGDSIRVRWDAEDIKMMEELNLKYRSGIPLGRPCH
jgi:hypothetical protein